MSALANQTNQNINSSYFFTKQELQTVLNDLSTLNLNFVLENPKFSTITMNPSGTINGGNGASIVGMSNITALANLTGSNITANGSIAAVGNISAAGGTLTGSNATISNLTTTPRLATQQLTTVSSINGVKFPATNVGSLAYYNLQGTLPSTVVGSNNATTISTIVLPQGAGVYGVQFLLQPYFTSTNTQALTIYTQGGNPGNGGTTLALVPPKTVNSSGFPTDFSATSFITTTNGNVNLQYIYPSIGETATFRGIAGCNAGTPFFGAYFVKLSS